MLRYLSLSFSPSPSFFFFLTLFLSHFFSLSEIPLSSPPLLLWGAAVVGFVSSSPLSADGRSPGPEMRPRRSTKVPRTADEPRVSAPRVLRLLRQPAQLRHHRCVCVRQPGAQNSADESTPLPQEQHAIHPPNLLRFQWMKLDVQGRFNRERDPHSTAAPAWPTRTPCRRAACAFPSCVRFSASPLSSQPIAFSCFIIVLCLAPLPLSPFLCLSFCGFLCLACFLSLLLSSRSSRGLARFFVLPCVVVFLLSLLGGRCRYILNLFVVLPRLFPPPS